MRHGAADRSRPVAFIEARRTHRFARFAPRRSLMHRIHPRVAPPGGCEWVGAGAVRGQEIQPEKPKTS